MGLTTYTTNDASTIKLFEKTLIPEALKETQVGKFRNTVINLQEELQRNKGDQITYQLDFNLTGTGQSEGESTDNNEETMVKATDALVINEIFEAVLVNGKNTIGAKRVGWDDMKRGFDNIRKWHSANLDISFFNQLAGNTANAVSGGFVDGRVYSVSDIAANKHSGFNTPTAPSANRHIIAGGQANDQSLTANDTFTLTLIDAAVEIARTATPFIEPIRMNGKDMYICFISEEQVTDLRRDTTGPVQWFDIQSSKLQAGDIEDNPIMTGEVGIYNSTMLIPSTRIPPGVDSGTSDPVANSRRAIFCGKGAIQGAFNDSPLFHEDAKNGGRELQINGGMVFGMKKAVFNNEDYASIVISTYAAPHTF